MTISTDSATSWIQVAATTVSGLVIASVIAYFSADRLKSVIDTAAVRAYVWCKDHPFLSIYIPLLAVVLAVAAVTSGLRLTSVLVAGAGWLSLVLMLSAVHRRRGAVLTSYFAPSVPDRMSIVSFHDGSTATIVREGSELLHVSADNDDQNYLYFRVADQLVRSLRRAPAVLLLVE